MCRPPPHLARLPLATAAALVLLTALAGVTSGGGSPNCPAPGDCFTPHPTPGCDDPACCDAVCFNDPFCCDTAWDNACVDGAFALCQGDHFGACCFEDASCQDLTEFDCINAGGIWQGPITDCISKICTTQPAIGACCLPDTNCFEDTELNCLDVGGNWQGPGTDCNINCKPAGACGDGIIDPGEDCDPPDGVTCDKNCQFIGPPNDDCFNAIPISQGTTNFDTTNATTDGLPDPLCDKFGFQQIDSDVWFCWTADCTGNVQVQTCGLTGVDTRIAAYDGCSCPAGNGILACNDDTCGLQSSIAFSAVAGASYLIRIGTFPGAPGGPGQFELTCITLPTGSCCLSDGSCIESITQQDCQNVGGQYAGDDIDCKAASCPQPQGACCLPDGTCIGPVTIDACSEQSGVFQGETTDCQFVKCPPPIGACCTEGACEDLSQADCDNLGGTYLGDLISCEFDLCPFGACCLADGGCVIADESSCGAFGGAFQGELTECLPSPCAPILGACCLADDACIITTGDDCAQAGGTYQGDNTPCSPDPCATGACCLLDGSCLETTESDCDAAGGVFNGPASTCTPDPCAAGACCLGDGNCIETTAVYCALADGDYLGDDVPCSPDACIVGACCFPGGGCAEIDPISCSAQGGLYQGNFTTCTESECGLGACCLADGNCLTLNNIDCANAGGAYQGDGSICSFGTCPPPVGACCLADGNCTPLTAEECLGFGGAYQGDATDCLSQSCLLAQGDLNSDCAVNGLDVANFTGCLTNELPSQDCHCGDYNQSGSVDNADIPMFVDDLVTNPAPAQPRLDNPKGIIFVKEIPSPEPCPPVNPKEHHISATWISVKCGIEEIKIINLTTGETLAEMTYAFCPTIMSLDATAMLGPADVIQTTVLTCGPNENHPCCLAPVTDEVKSCPIQGATYLGIADEDRSIREMRTLTCPGAPANSMWQRTKLGQGDLTPAANAGATYPITVTHESTPVDDVRINRGHTDPDGDDSGSAAKLTVIGVDMKIHKPKVLDPAETEIADDKELSEGAQTVVNLDNDDRDSLFDTKDVIDDTDVPGEDEMCKLRLRIKPADLPDPCGNVQLTAFEGAGAIKVWEKPNKNVEYTLGDDIAVPSEFTKRGDWLEKDLWIEGRSPHTAQRETKLRMTYDQVPANIKDEVALTIVGIETIEWVGRSNSETDTNNLDNEPNWPAGLAPGSVRVFPDARVVSGAVEANPRDQVDVKVTLTVEPVGGIKFFFDSFDVDDPSSSTMPVDDPAGSENADEDNRGTVPARSGQFVKADGTSDEDGNGIKMHEFTMKMESFRFRVTMQPGDNFRVVGNADRDFLLDLENRDGQLNTSNADKQRIINKHVTGTAAQREVRDVANYASNQVLTVWRRLHVERDSMAGFPAAPAAQSNFLDRTIASITGNAVTAQRIFTTANIPVSVDTTGNGAADTMDNSANLSGGGAGNNGRFEGGFVIVEPANLAVQTNNLQGNGTNFIQRNGGISIPFQVSNGPLAVATGQVIALAGNTFTLNVTGGALLAGHAGGTLQVAGNNMAIAAAPGGVNLAMSQVTTAAAPALTIRIHDDDDDNNAIWGLPTAVLVSFMSDSDMMASNLYADAYIRPKFNEGGTAGADTQTVPPILNTESPLVYQWGSRANNSNRFWVVYLLTAWQDSFRNLRRDRDPNNESSTGGSTSTASSGSLIYEESIRERGPTAAGGAFDLEKRVVCHEVGHQMRLGHGDNTNNFANNGIMNRSNQAGPTGANLRFVPRELNTLRGINRPR